MVMHNPEDQRDWHHEYDPLLWTLPMATDIDEDGTLSLVVQVTDPYAPPPDGVFVVELTDQVTIDGHSIWRLVNE